MVHGTPVKPASGDLAGQMTRSTFEMRIKTWRLLLTGGAVVILAAIGIGLAAAANAPAPPASNIVPAAATPGPDATGVPARHSRERLSERVGERFGQRREDWGARLLRLGRHLVHAEATVTDRDGNLVELWFDHGTVKAVGGSSLVIAEAGGKTETVTIDDATIVYVGREDGTLQDVTVGVEVFVQSRVEGGTALAKRILVIPARSS
jgi:hypothetical protein